MINYLKHLTRVDLENCKMGKRTLCILAITVLLAVLGVLIPLPLAGQDYSSGSGQQVDQFGNPIRSRDNDNLHNPYSDMTGNPFEEEGDRQQDTTQRERKPRKPLESYFFDDSTRVRPNFSWHVNSKRNRIELIDIDTALMHMQLVYPFQRKGVGDAYQGNLGAASIPLNYFDRPDYKNFRFGQAFDSYYFFPETAPHFNVKRPFSKFDYFMSGQTKYFQENFGIFHAQNISPSSGFNLDYKSRGERGRYEWSKSRAKNLSVAFSHTGKRYSVHAGYIYNAELNKENGGIVDDIHIINPNIQQNAMLDLTENIPVRLADARNTVKNNTYYIIQSYAIPFRKPKEDDFSLADQTSIFIGHSFEYNRWHKTYTDTREGTRYSVQKYDENNKPVGDPVTHEYYENWHINSAQTRDSIFESRIANRFFIQLQPWSRDAIVGTIDAGVGMENHFYYQFNPRQVITGKSKGEKRTEYYMYGSIEGKLKKYLNWGADVQMHPSGFRSGDMSVEAHLKLSAYIRNHPITLSGRFVYERRTADYWTSNLYSNHFVWNNSFEKENETRIEALLEIPSINLEVGVSNAIIKNKIYLNNNVEPTQDGGNVNVTGVYARKDFRLGGFNFNHRVLLQWSTSQESVPVPLASAFLSYFFEFNVVKNVLRLQVGLDARYNTKYYAFGYNPAIAQFYNQREKRYGEYPKVDIFVNAKWKRMRILLKMEHLNQGMFGSRNYFTLKNYPQNPRIFTMGFSWAFYD